MIKVSLVPLTLVLSLAVLANSQSPAPTTSSQTKEQTTPARADAEPSTPNKPKTESDAERELKIKRTQARSLLIALATDAQTFGDQPLRARSLARIADALWTVDAERSRLLFRKAWDAAEVADQESDRKLQEEISRQKARTGGGFALNLPPNIRREVLRLAGRHDRALGNEFLEKWKTQKQEAATNTRADNNRLPEALSQRLSLARDLLQANEVEQALKFADIALTTVTIDSINFLSDLREKDSVAADSRYSALLANAAGNPQTDANTVSLLSSYIFTPHLFITFSRSGTSSSQSSSSVTPANVSPELRNAFFQAASAILMRPQPPPDQDQSTTGLDGKYLVMRRMLPLFEQGAPRELVDALRGQLDALNAVVSEGTRRRDDEWARHATPSEQSAEEQEQTLLDRIDRAKTSAERDSLYIQLASRVMSRSDLRARDIVSKIEDPELRKQISAYVDGSLVMNSINKKLTDQAIELARKGDLTHLQRAWALSQCAKLLAKTDHDKAMDLIEEASQEAHRIEVSDPNAPKALLAIANAFRVLDESRSWDATFEAVKAANSAEGFTGEDGELVLKFQTKGQSSVHSSDVAEFDVEGIFRELAKEDYDRAVELARGFQGEGPRAVATIAIARTMLDLKPPKTK